MKYVIFKYRQLIMPVIIPDHITHSQIVIKEAEPISAGFFRQERGMVKVYGKSESLALEPGRDDARIIDNALSDAPTSAFLDL